MDPITTIKSPAIEATVTPPAFAIADGGKTFKMPSEFTFALPAGITAPTFCNSFFDDHTDHRIRFASPAPTVTAPSTPAPSVPYPVFPPPAKKQQVALTGPATTPAKLRMQNEHIQVIQDRMGQLAESTTTMSKNVREFDIYVKVDKSVSLVKKHVALLTRIDENTDSLTSGCLSISQRSKEFSEHVKQFEPIFDQLFQGQTLSGKLITKSIELMQTVDRKVDNIMQCLALVVEKAVEKSMSGFRSETLRHFRDLEMMLQDQEVALGKSLSAFKSEISIVNDSITTLKSEVLAEAQQHFKRLETSILQAHKPTIEEFVDEGFEAGFETDLGNGEDPITQLLFPQGDRRWSSDKRGFRVSHGGQGLEEAVIRTSRGRERFENGIVRVGRGGGGGGGWCVLM